MPPVNRLLWPEGALRPDRMFWQVALPALAAIIVAGFLVLPSILRINLAVLLGLLVAIEVGFVVAESFRAPGGTSAVPVVTEESFVIEPHPILGYRPAPNQRATRRRTQGSAVLYDVVYTIGPAGWRVSTPPGPDAPRSRFIAVFGDSFVFGSGLQDHETLPVQLATLAPDHRAYNFGVPGYGPQQNLAIVSELPVREWIAERRGVALFILGGDSLARLVGTMPVHLAFAHQHPLYRLDAAGQVVHAGSLTTGRPFTAALFPLLARSATIRRYGWPLPDPYSRQNLTLAAKLLRSSCDHLRHAFLLERCVLLLHPTATALVPLIDRLRREGVDYLDYPALRERGPVRVLHPR